jgi:hypothetical protein
MPAPDEGRSGRHGQVRSSPSHQRMRDLAEVLLRTRLATALKPRGRVDQGFAQAAQARAQETCPSTPATDPPRRGVERLTDCHAGNRDQAEPVDRPMVRTYGQSSAVLTDGDPQQGAGVVTDGGQLGAPRGPVRHAHHLHRRCRAEVRMGGAQSRESLGRLVRVGVADTEVYRDPPAGVRVAVEPDHLVGSLDRRVSAGRASRAHGRDVLRSHGRDGPRVTRRTGTAANYPLDCSRTGPRWPCHTADPH